MSTTPTAEAEAPIVAESTSLPFRMGTPDEFARLRAFLQASGYTFASILEREERVVALWNAHLEAATKNNEDIDELERRLPDPVDLLDVLWLLLMRGSHLSWPRMRELVPREGIEALEALQLLVEADLHPADVCTTIMITPIRGLLLASDHVGFRVGKEIKDLVFSPLTANSQQFVAVTPSDPADAVLELCSGSGVGAFAAARAAGHVWAVDITERSTHFAEFNVELNGLTNTTVLRGDMYEPVRGLTFDRIIAHPPYVPAFQQEMIFRDGGADGEQLTRRVIGGAPEALRPGGRLYCLCMATDRQREPFIQRVRRWLGDRSDEFDVAFFDLAPRQEPTEFFARNASGNAARLAQLGDRDRFFREVKAEAFVYGVLVLQRRREPRPTFTTRREGTGATISSAIEWALRWDTAATDPSLPNRILDACPRVSEYVTIQITHERRDGQFVASGFAVLTNSPFHLELSFKPWISSFLLKCDGKSTIRQLLAHFQEKGTIPTTATEEEFARFVMDYITRGIVEIDGFEIPAPRLPLEELAGR